MATVLNLAAEQSRFDRSLIDSNLVVGHVVDFVVVQDPKW